MGVYVVISEGQAWHKRGSVKVYAADGYRAASYEVEAPNGFSGEDTFKVFMPLHDKAEEKPKYYSLIGEFIGKGDVLRKSWYSIRGLKESVKNSDVTVPINDVDTPILRLFGLWVKSSFIEDFYNNIPVGEDELSPVFLEVIANDHPDIPEHLRLQCGLYECVIMPIKLKEEPSG